MNDASKARETAERRRLLHVLPTQGSSKLEGSEMPKRAKDFPQVPGPTKEVPGTSG